MCSGQKPFATFFNGFKAVVAAVKGSPAITRLRAGNTGDSKSVGKGVSEFRIDWGPGQTSLLWVWDGA